MIFICRYGLEADADSQSGSNLIILHICAGKCEGSVIMFLINVNQETLWQFDGCQCNDAFRIITSGCLCLFPRANVSITGYDIVSGIAPGLLLYVGWRFWIVVGSSGSLLEMDLWFPVNVGVEILLEACEWKSICLDSTVRLTSNATCSQAKRVERVSNSLGWF